MNPSGGLLWHIQAWRSQALWKATNDHLAQWLHSIKPLSKELLLIGASAGWMMPTSWLKAFKVINTYDVDRFAPLLFKKRHGKPLAANNTQLNCHHSDAISHLPSLLRAHPRAFLLFDNVLGQLRFHHKTVEAAETQLKTITTSLRGRQWASIHDAYSGPTHTPWTVQRIANSGIPCMHAIHQPNSTQADSEELQGDPSWLAHLNAKGPWLDHLSNSIFPAGTPVQHTLWPYSANYCHWLQAGWVQ